MTRTRNQTGFTLIELMVVIAIIASIAAIAIPNLVSARKSANETAAIALLRAVHTAQSMYHDRDLDKNGVQDYARESGPLAGILGVAQAQADRTYHGYFWGVIDDRSEPEEATFFAVAVPASFGRSGDRQFTIDETGVIRFAAKDILSPTRELPSYAELRTWLPLQ